MHEPLMVLVDVPGRFAATWLGRSTGSAGIGSKQIFLSTSTVKASKHTWLKLEKKTFALDQLG